MRSAAAGAPPDAGSRLAIAEAPSCRDAGTPAAFTDPGLAPQGPSPRPGGRPERTRGTARTIGAGIAYARNRNMDLTSDHSYWIVKSGLLCDHPALVTNQRCDIVVIGAGITGALVSEALTADGHSVVILDVRDVGHGSTSASTALLQYEIDTAQIQAAGEAVS